MRLGISPAVRSTSRTVDRHLRDRAPFRRRSPRDGAPAARQEGPRCTLEPILSAGSGGDDGHMDQLAFSAPISATSDSDAWLNALRSSGSTYDQAVDSLHGLL